MKISNLMLMDAPHDRNTLGKVSGNCDFSDSHAIPALRHKRLVESLLLGSMHTGARDTHPIVFTLCDDNLTCK